jgi:excisionase family DNA binding protein
LLVSINDAAAVLAVSAPTVWRLVSAKRLAVVRLGGRTLLRQEDLAAFVATLEAGTPRATPHAKARR